MTDIRSILVPSSSVSSSRSCMFVPYCTVIKIPQCISCTGTHGLACWPGKGGYLWVDRSYSRDRYCHYCHYCVHCSIVVFCTDTVIRWVCLLLQRKLKLSDEIFKIVRSTRVDPNVLSYGEGRLWLFNHAVRFKAQRLSCPCATRFSSPKPFSQLGPNLFQNLPCSRNCVRSWP